MPGARANGKLRIDDPWKPEASAFTCHCSRDRSSRGCKWDCVEPQGIAQRVCNSTNMSVQVECYSGRKADQRPVRFRMDEHEYVIEELLDQWYGPEDA